MKDSLRALDTVFVRKPLYNFSNYKKIPDTKEGLNEFITTLWFDEVFKEALYLASEVLYTQWEKFVQNKTLTSSKDMHRLNKSILKYYMRISSRSTPFGLFASHSSCSIKKKDTTNRISQDKFRRISSINLEYFLNIVDYLNTNSKFRELHSFKINTSLYTVGTSFRYIERIKNKGMHEFVLSSIEADEVLALISYYIKDKPITFIELNELLLNSIDSISKDQVLAYVEDLISSQFLVTDFDICLNDRKPLDQLIEFIGENKGKCCTHELESLERHLFDLKQMLSRLDHRLGNKIEIYRDLALAVEKFGIPFPRTSLVNVNLIEHINELSIDDEDVKNVKIAINVLATLTPTGPSNESFLEEFGTAFYEKYGDQAIPLVQALDTDSGIGYKQNQLGENDFSGLIDDIEWANQENDIEVIKFNKNKHKFWKDLITEAFKANEIIDLKLVDENRFKNGPNIMARSFSSLTKKIGDKILIDTVGGNTALGLIARFSTDDNSVREVVDEIIEIEELDDNFLHVELLFLPNEKAGNIVLREIKRKYEFPYLTKESRHAEALNINDIFIKYSNGAFTIFSEKFGKKLKIYHSNAHNYHYNSLPLYQFLCDLQMQNEHNLNLDIGRANFIFFDHIPRITYGSDIILSQATWRIMYEQLVTAESESYDFEAVKFELKRRKIPQYFYLSYADNKLLIDSSNNVSLEILLDDLKKKGELIITEFLYDMECSDFDNEVVFSFINENKYSTSVINEPILNKSNVQRTFIPGDEWVYFKIYIGQNSGEKFLLNTLPRIIEDLKECNIITSWFFIRYNDPLAHIRLRFHLLSEGEISILLQKLNTALKLYVDQSVVSKVEISTYEREIERYEGEYIYLSERIFFYDSELVLKLKGICQEIHNEWLYSLKCIDGYFDLFSFRLDEKLPIIENLFSSFHDEFNSNSKVRKQLDLKFRKYSKDLEMTFSSVNSTDRGHQIIHTWLSTCSTQFGDQISSMAKDTAINLVTSFIHMHVNRMVKARQRRHEFVFYALLFKYYKSRAGNVKYNN
ncbi:lantibiotic dehydratase [Elizabethkingia ursingii]|uniref:lantibiotic dehydratase n=1 Tax=Elizabethkingia ursingii TaxID=1756150 RepID=UPI0020126521|nr:lantibiotic dehydratase [Elizabethkingia ursingii]MCL1665435.1 lantibiotic dehydratase [Elizabethkingia ursingii]